MTKRLTTPLLLRLVCRLMRRNSGLHIELRRVRRALARGSRPLEREIRRLSELNEAYRAKLEITQAEMLDRILEMTRVLGAPVSSVAWATREATDKITDLRFQQFQRPTGADPDQTRAVAFPATYEDLTQNERSAYDAMYQTHREIGMAKGLTDAEIKQFWEQNAHEDAIETVVSRFGPSN